MITTCKRCGGAVLVDIEGNTECLLCARDPSVTLVVGTLPDKGNAEPRLYGIANGMAMGRSIPMLCKICGGVFYVYPSEVKRRHTCGHPCRIEARRRANK